MLAFPEVVLKAINRVAVPLLKTTLQDCMSRQLGSNWFSRAALPILQHSESYGELQKKGFPAGDPLKNLDAAAVLFLLFPPQNQNLTGLETYLQNDSFYALRNQQLKNLRGIREMRNACSHAFGTDLASLPAGAASGDEERNMLDALVTALQPLDPAVGGRISPYYQELQDELAKLQKANPTVASTRENRIYLQEVNAIRQEFQAIRRFDFARDPIHMPLVGIPPWADDALGLDTLIWPSERMEEEAAAAKAAKKKKGLFGWL